MEKYNPNKRSEHKNMDELYDRDVKKVRSDIERAKRRTANVGENANTNPPPADPNKQ